jgi:hypothetical protein
MLVAADEKDGIITATGHQPDRYRTRELAQLFSRDRNLSELRKVMLT